VFVQITRTIPLRRTILQFSQIRLTLARTFMAQYLSAASIARIVVYIRKNSASQLRHAVRISSIHSELNRLVI
jgi:hypothetical protein